MIKHISIIYIIYISINENHFHLICGIAFSSRFSIFQLDPFGEGAKVSPPQSAASRPAGEKLVPFFWWCEMQTWLVVSHIFYILFLWRSMMKQFLFYQCREQRNVCKKGMRIKKKLI